MTSSQPIHVKDFFALSKRLYPLDESAYFISEVIPMVLKFQCPECGKGEKSELVEVLPDRRYRMKCADCECTYILPASADEENKCKKSCGAWRFPLNVQIPGSFLDGFCMFPSCNDRLISSYGQTLLQSMFSTLTAIPNTPLSSSK